jgi:hypothetical protein
LDTDRAKKLPGRANGWPVGMKEERYKFERIVEVV